MKIRITFLVPKNSGAWHFLPGFFFFFFCDIPQHKIKEKTAADILIYTTVIKYISTVSSAKSLAGEHFEFQMDVMVQQLSTLCQLLKEK